MGCVSQVIISTISNRAGDFIWALLYILYAALLNYLGAGGVVSSSAWECVGLSSAFLGVSFKFLLQQQSGDDT